LGSQYQNSGFKALILLCPPLAQAAQPTRLGSEHLLGPSERLLNLAAVPFFSKPGVGMCVEPSAGNS